MNTSIEDSTILTKDRDERRNIGKRKKRREVIDLFESGMYFSVDEIAEIAGITEKSARNYLGKRRIARIEGNEPENTGMGTKRKERSTSRPKSKDGRLTLEKVNRIVAERNERIRQLYADNVAIEEIASIENLTTDQVKEIYYSLGLSTYTEQELKQIQAKREAKRKEEERERKRELARKKKERIKAEEGEKAAEAEDGEQEDEVAERSFRGIVNKMKGYVDQGNSKAAIEYAEKFVDDADFLSKKEKDELFILVQYIKSKRKEYKSSRNRYQGNHDGENR